MIGLPLRSPWRGVVVAAVFAAAPVLAYLGPLGFPVLVALGGLLLLPAWVKRPSPWTAAALLGLPLVWGLGSVGWSSVRPLSFSDYDAVEGFTGLKLVMQLAVYGLFAAAAAGVSGASAQRAVRLLSYGLIGLALVVVLEGFSQAKLYQWLKSTFEDPIRSDLAVRNVGQAAVVLVLLAWAAFPWLQRRRPWGVYALVIAIVISPLLLGQASPVVALLAGAVAAWLVMRFGRRGAWLVGGAMAAAVMLFPWLLEIARIDSSALPASWEARLDIWPYAAARIAERPWVGWGLDASRGFGPAVPLHPHNAGLQVWLELGVVGAGLLAALWVWVFVAVGRVAERDRVGAAACAGAATAYFTIGGLSFGVWQEWWLALGALTAAACAVMLAARTHERMAEPVEQLHEGGLTPL